ncbi:hypothetical protein V2I01_27175 [Micromonospora sp. BRA006-A]|nr:hypothetical protein [Micromonospora sp. BRA006-A]
MAQNSAAHSEVDGLYAPVEYKLAGDHQGHRREGGERPGVGHRQHQRRRRLVPVRRQGRRDHRGEHRQRRPVRPPGAGERLPRQQR